MKRRRDKQVRKIAWWFYGNESASRTANPAWLRLFRSLGLFV